MLAFTPVFLLITSPLMLGELPSFSGLTGVLLIVFGTYFLGIRNVSESYLAPFKALVKEKGSLIMLFVAFIFSIGANFVKIGIQHSNSLFFLIVYNAFISGLLLLVILPKSKKSARGIGINSKVLFTAGLFNALMNLFVMKAMELAIVPYVISVKRTTILFSMLYGRFFFKEKRVLERLTGCLVMLLGVLLISLF